MDYTCLLKDLAKFTNNLIRYSAMSQVRCDMRFNSGDECIVKVFVNRIIRGRRTSVENQH